ncbi:hypothetical protein [Nonomuraea africana]|uniref:Uncharacterized protein n=1 Tax=Nonomuraea africana TaxID=46171 RepID=A0ABR9KDF9_9ACTN|nr:hypothetical protein [Nonomuraea africana]MBE1559753.1 hypothetical protein [Nonomuraea africana]
MDGFASWVVEQPDPVAEQYRHDVAGDVLVVQGVDVGAVGARRERGGASSDRGDPGLVLVTTFRIRSFLSLS